VSTPDSLPKPTQISLELVGQLIQRFGSQANIPPELKDAAFLIHMRLLEAEQDIDRFWQRLAHYEASSSPQNNRDTIAGAETGEF
jgi:hypothetical protein